MPVSEAAVHQLDRTVELIVDASAADQVVMLGWPDADAWYTATAWRDGVLIDVEAGMDANTAVVRLLRTMVGGQPCPTCGRKQVVWHAPDTWANRATWEGAAIIDGTCALSYQPNGWHRSCD